MEGWRRGVVNLLLHASLPSSLCSVPPALIKAARRQPCSLYTLYTMSSQDRSGRVKLPLIKSVACEHHMHIHKHKCKWKDDALNIKTAEVLHTLTY